jgi:hypothetical protein
MNEITLTVEANVRWWVRPLLRLMERTLNACVWLITKYGVAVTVPK